MGPPAASIWSLKALMTIGSLDVLGSISLIESILIVRRFALWREPMIEWQRCSASSDELATMSMLNFCLWLPNGAVPDIRKACMFSPTYERVLNAPSRSRVCKSSTVGVLSR